MSMKDIEERRAALRKAHAEAYAAQYEIDFAAQVDLEDEHGFGRVHPVRIEEDGWHVGAPTQIVVLLPVARDLKFKRFQQQIGAKNATAAQKLAASKLLADSCTVYPAAGSDELAAVLELAPGISEAAAAQIVTKVQGRAAEEGK